MTTYTIDPFGLAAALRRVLVGVVVLGLGGCFGPAAVRHTRARYNEAIQATNSEELLLNIVRLRYGEAPQFLPVTALNAQFELGASGLGRGGVDRGDPSNFGEGRLDFADRPTISFAPQRTPEQTKGLLSRIPLETFYLFAATGNDPDRLMRLLIRSMNGIDNAAAGGGPTPACPPEFAEFRRVAELIGALQAQRGLAFAVENREADILGAVPVASISTEELVKIKQAGYGVRSLEDRKGYVLTQTKPVRVVRIQPEAVAAPEMLELAALLRLRPLQDTYEIEEVVEGQFRPTELDGERTKITITMRSLLEVMFLLSQMVDVPPEHVCKGLVPLTTNPDGTAFDWSQVLGDLFRVCADRHKPKRAYVAVKYRGYWFYIDDADVTSKLTLALFNELFRLQRIGAAEGQPLLTLPVGR